MSYTYLHLKSDDLTALETLCTDFKYVLKIQQGRDATEETVDSEGNIIPAQPAIGDPDYWYTTIMFLHPVEIVISNPIEYADEEVVKALCGSWL